jgi:tetratricopeptide (TPR) repeat protein
MDALEQGKKHFENENYQAALDCFTSFLSMHILHADALFFRAICHRKLGDYKSSIIDFTAVLKKLPEEATIYSERGVSYFHNKQIDLSLQDMDKAVALEPHKAYRYSSRAFIKAYKDVEGAIADYKKAIALDPEDEISYNNLGLLEENQGRYKEAQESYKKSNEIIGYHPEQRQQPTPPSTPETTATTPSFGSVFASVFTSQAARKDFWNFVKNIFGKGKE